MLDMLAFYLLTAFIAVSSVLMFIQKRLSRAVIALTAAFFGSAMVILLMGQTLIALLQLIIFVGGLSIYLIVSVATEEKNPQISVPLQRFAAIVVVLFAALSLMLKYVPQSQTSFSSGFLALAASSIISGYPVLYLMAILLFGIAIGSVLVLKRFMKLIV